MPEIYNKVGGNWRQTDLVWAKVSGTWRPVRRVYKKENGVWRLSYEPVLTITNTNNHSSNVNQTGYAWASNFGAAPAAGERRFIIGVIASTRATENVSNGISDVNFAGLGGNIVTTSINLQQLASIAWAEVPTGTSGNINANFSFAQGASSMAVYRVIAKGGLGMNVFDTKPYTGGSNVSQSLAVPRGGLLVGCAQTKNSGNNAPEMQGGTKTLSFEALTDDEWAVAGFNQIATAQNVTVSWSNLANYAATFASFGPI